MNSRVTIVQTASANLASILGALGRLGVDAAVSAEPRAVTDDPLVLLPGVGAFGPAMDLLRREGLDRALIDRVRANRPLLGICLGLQLLCESSDESPGTPGLGIIPHRVKRFDSALRVPHMGWNSITLTTSSSLLEPGFAYFANSYRLLDLPHGWQGAWCDYGGPFIAALQHGHILACQFHPELSGPFGQQLLARWIAAATNPEPAPC